VAATSPRAVIRCAASVMANMASMGTRSMFGDQSLSKRSSAPQYGFGSSTREHQSRVFVSPEHAKLAVGGNRSPGPAVYQLRNSVGAQIDGRKNSAPQWAFGTAERFNVTNRHINNPGPGTYDSKSALGTQATSQRTSQPIFGFGSSTRENVSKVFVSEGHNKDKYGVASPGPAVYNQNASIGKQESSRRANQPAWVFGSTQRFQYDHVKRAAGSPGPGAYSAHASVGPQIASTKASSPMPGFGSSTRAHQDKVYLSPDHEKSYVGLASPGPATYTLTPSTGKQYLSQIHTSASWGFGTAARWKSEGKQSPNKLNTPGPGAYCV